MRAFADSSATDRARSGGDSSAVHPVCFPLMSSTHDSLPEPRMGSVIENLPSLRMQWPFQEPRDKGDSTAGANVACTVL
jgi:hypothetical protein